MKCWQKWLLAGLAAAALVAARFQTGQTCGLLRRCFFGGDSPVTEVFCPDEARQEVMGYGQTAD